tara:strand:+ start:569 stop:766 length:198 start_codon:yes stop_codon:yes gene_type:complete
MNLKSGLMRLGVLVSGLLFLGWVILPLNIYNFAPFNSGVSTVIGILALLWLVYTVGTWIMEGFKK